MSANCPQIQNSLSKLFDLRDKYLEAFSDVNENKGHRDPDNKQKIEYSLVLREQIQLALEATELQFNDISFTQLAKWLQETKTPDGKTLESKLEEGSLETLIARQERFYQQMYYQEFTIDRSRIRIDKSRLKAIAVGLETGAINYPLIIATPEIILNAEQDQTEAQFVYHQLLEPLKEQGLKIWAEESSDDPNNPERWSELTLEQLLAGYIPVTLDDFKDSQGNIAINDSNWVQEIQRIIKAKKQAPQVQPRQIKLVFTDARQDIPKETKPINIAGEQVENKHYFIEMVKTQINVLTPQEWITIAAQLYHEDETYLSSTTWDWTMAVVQNKEGIDPPVSIANAYSGDDGVGLSSGEADNGHSIGRWRLSL